MSTLTARLNANKQNAQPVMYSKAGADFQEYAISILDNKGSEAHKAIGQLVTKINNNQISVSEATNIFVALLK